MSLRVDEDDTGGPRGGSPLLDWEPRPEHPFRARLDEVDGGYRFWVKGLGTFVVEPAIPRVTMPAGAEAVRREERMWGVPMALCLDVRGDLPLHASAAEVGGKGLVFLGPGRFGKTTLAAAFHERGHRVLAEDLTCVRLGSNPSILPGPALLRLRPDVHSKLRLPDVYPVADDPERIHLAIDPSRRGNGTPVPLAGLVILRRGTPDIQLYRVPAARFLPEIASVAWLLPGERERLRIFDKVTRVATQVPVWLLDRPLEFDTLPDVIDRLIGECLST